MRCSDNKSEQKFDSAFFQCYDEAVIEEMTEDREMLTNPELVEKRKDLQSNMRNENPLVQQKMQQFDPRKSNVLTTLAAEERDKAASRTA